MKQADRYIPPLDPYAAESFHQYLLKFGPVGRLMRERGLSMETIKEYKIGHTGTHFTIPVYDGCGCLSTIRYRADEVYLDRDAKDFRKYDSTWGCNSAVLYPMPIVQRLSVLETLWI